MRINLIHIAPLLAAGAAAVAISAAPPAAAAPIPAEKICTESVSGSQCESAGNVEINNTPTTHFTPQYPMLGDACCFITAVARSQMRLVVGDSVRSNTLADPRLHQRGEIRCFTANLRPPSHGRTVTMRMKLTHFTPPFGGRSRCGGHHGKSCFHSAIVCRHGRMTIRLALR